MNPAGESSSHNTFNAATPSPLQRTNLQWSNSQTAIEIPDSPMDSDMSTRTVEDPTNEANVENGRDGTQTLQFNIEINPEAWARNLNTEEFSTLVASIRQLIQSVDLVYFVPESSFMNFIMLFSTICCLLFGRIFVNAFGLILLCIIRMTYYYDSIFFKLKNEVRLAGMLVRIITRNLLIYLVYDQSVYFKVLTFNIVETESFIYTLFITFMANLIVFDAMMVAKVLLAYIPNVQMRHKREFVKVIEHFMMLYVSTLPVIQWYEYFGNTWLALPYLILKFVIYSYLIVRTFAVLGQFLRVVKIGNAPSKSEISDKICAICHCELEKAVKISCGHIFDEQCLKEWLEVKNECPLCRRTVIERHTNFPNIHVFPPHLF